MNLWAAVDVWTDREVLLPLAYLLTLAPFLRLLFPSCVLERRARKDYWVPIKWLLFLFWLVAWFRQMVHPLAGQERGSSRLCGVGKLISLVQLK